jgi:hypothetical protein
MRGVGPQAQAKQIVQPKWRLEMHAAVRLQPAPTANSGAVKRLSASALHDRGAKASP